MQGSIRQAGRQGRGLGLVALLMLLGACGFRPMMGAASPDQEVADQLAQVDIAVIKDRSGQIMRNRLIDGFYHQGRPSHPIYRLDVVLDAGEEALAVQKDATASRGQWTVTATYRLSHIASGRILFQGNSRALPGYNISYAQYGSMVSQENAYQRGIEYLSDEIRTRISLYFARESDQKLRTTPVAAPAPVPNPGLSAPGLRPGQVFPGGVSDPIRRSPPGAGNERY